MLLTDSDILTLADLTAIDSEVAEVATLSDPGIVLEGDGGMIREAWGEARDTLLAGQQAYGSGYGNFAPGSAALTAIMDSIAPGVTKSRVFAQQIVVDNGGFNRDVSSLVRWFRYKTLMLIFQNASERYSQDRFERKAAAYAERTRDAWARLARLGLPIVRFPLSAPGALHDAKAAGGVFDGSAISATGTSSSSVPASFDLAITWVNGNAYQTPSNPNNGESAPSATVSFTIPAAAQSALISIAALTPPDGTSPYNAWADGILAPMQATHWNVYAGLQGGGMLFLQNSTPIPVATQTWAGYPVLSGPRLSRGQKPDIKLPFRTLFQRS